MFQVKCVLKFKCVLLPLIPKWQFELLTEGGLKRGAGDVFLTHVSHQGSERFWRCVLVALWEDGAGEELNEQYV